MKIYNLSWLEYLTVTLTNSNLKYQKDEKEIARNQEWEIGIYNQQMWNPYILVAVSWCEWIKQFARELLELDRI